MLKPYDFDFSHPALRKCFSIDLVKKIREFIKAYKDFLDLLLESENEFDKYFGDINVYYAVKNYVDYSLSGVADMSSRNWEYFFQHYSMKRRCEKLRHVVK